MSQDTVQQIQENIRQAKEIVDLEVALERLSKNTDFRKVIKEGYLEKEAIRLVHLRGDPAFQTPDRQAAVMRQIDAIAELSSFFRTISFNADIARKAIESDEAMVEEILSGGDE